MYSVDMIDFLGSFTVHFPAHSPTHSTKFHFMAFLGKISNKAIFSSCFSSQIGELDSEARPAHINSRCAYIHVRWKIPGNFLHSIFTHTHCRWYTIEQRENFFPREYFNKKNSLFQTAKSSLAQRQRKWLRNET